MTIKTYSGRITVLGDSVSSSNAAASQNTYSYIELESGEIIRRVKTMMGLDGQLRAAYKENEIVELHFNEILTGVPDPGSVLLAVRRGSGKLYATHIPDIPAIPFAFSVAPIVCFVFGLPTLFIFGLGAILWALGLKLHFAKKKMVESRKLIVEAKNYIKSLNGAIEI